MLPPSLSEPLLTRKVYVTIINVTRAFLHSRTLTRRRKKTFGVVAEKDFYHYINIVIKWPFTSTKAIFDNRSNLSTFITTHMFSNWNRWRLTKPHQDNCSISSLTTRRSCVITHRLRSGDSSSSWSSHVDRQIWLVLGVDIKVTSSSTSVGSITCP